MGGWKLALVLVALAPAATPTPVRAQPSPDAEARQLMGRFEREPNVNQVQAAALSYAVMHPELYEAMRGRSRWAAVLPDLRVRVTKDLDEQSRSLTRFDTNSRPQDISATETEADGLQLQGEVRWRLGDVVFNARETAVVRENRYVAKERQRLLQTVTQVYFERRRAQIDLLMSPPGDATARTLAELRVAELTAELDGMTGGAFSRMVAGQ